MSGELSNSSPSHSGTIERPYSWWIAAMALVIASLSFGALTSVPVLLKPLAREWQTGAGETSLAFTAAMFGTAVGSLVYSRMVDRTRFFAIGIFAALGTGAGLLLAAHAERLGVLSLAYGVFVGAIGQGGLFSPLTAAVAQWFDRYRAFAIAFVACGQCTGGLLFPPLLRWGASEFGWRPTLRVFGICATVIISLSLLAFRRSPPLPVAPPALATGPRSPEMGRWDFVIFGLCMSLFNYAAFTAMGHLTAYGEELGLAPGWSASVLSAMLGVALFSRLSIGYLAGRWGTYRALLVMATLHTGGALALAASSGSIKGSTAAAMLIGLGFGGYLPAFAIAVREIFPVREAGRRISEIYCFGFCAAGVGSWSTGWLRDVTGGYGFPFWVGAMSALGGLLLLATLGRSARVVFLVAPGRQVGPR